MKKLFLTVLGILTILGLNIPLAVPVSAVVTFTVNASAGVGGTISPNGAVTVESGASQEFAITPNAGNIVFDVRVDGVSVGSPRSYTFSNVTADHTITATFTTEPLPPPDLNPLNQTVVPEPPNLVEFVKSKPAAVRLGKAFFWDMQVGSDGVQSCASCHFSAGADNRLKNTANPGKNGAFNVVGPGGTLQPGDFPFHQRAAPADSQFSATVRNSDDVVGSQGVRLTEFVDIVEGSPVDNMTPVADPVFNTNGANTRRVTGRNTPTVINAIFNFTNFWDGRASFIFNGNNPFGPADLNAGVWFNDVGGLVKRSVAIQFASLASQATGPPMDHTEMSARGRTFPKLGKKMLSLTPLGQQLVHPGDSVLGPLSKATLQPNGKYLGNGLNTTYTQMIKDAFQDKLWNATALTPDGYTHMEANFSLYWGLAIQMYVATLVSDQAPFDRWLGGDLNALTDQQKVGFDVFDGNGGCAACHTGIEFTASSATNAAFLNNTDNALIELMFVADGTRAIYDDGFNNTGVTLTTDDVGRGGNTPFTNPLTNQPIPLSFTARALLQAKNLLPFLSPILDPFIPLTIRDNSNGLFKVPGLRNVELTAPYFHNGGIMTLEDVVDFYVRGGNFPKENAADLDPVVGQGLPLLQGNKAAKDSLVAFMKSLTDPRVKNESAPFDHPELLVPSGDTPDLLLRIPARDANGAAAPSPSLTLNPVTTLTNQGNQTISGTVTDGLTPTVSVNSAATVGPVTVAGTDWSAEISGLVEGANVITVSVVDAGVETTLTGTVSLDTVLPGVTINAVTTPTRLAGQTLSGTTQAGTTVRISVNGGAATTATVTGNIWSFNANLSQGPNTIAVTATDAAGNVASLPEQAILVDTTPPVISLNAVTTPTNLMNQTLSGSTETGATVTVSVNSGAPAAATVIDAVWSFEATLVPGQNTIAVTATDAAGNTATLQPTTITVTVKSPAILSIALPAGWNLLSTPVKLGVEAQRMDQIFTVAQSANIEIMYRWTGGQWRQVGGGDALTPLDAFYVKVKPGLAATANLVPSPDLSSPPSRSLSAGLNLIGVAPALELGAFPAKPLDQLLASVVQAAGGARGFSIVISPPHNQDGWTYVTGGQVRDLLPFRGYWVIMDNADTMFGFSTTPLP
ncbi:MAG: hypothetical protein HY670_02920 [Chloroflexi bacterium]|nr:hypothetical protein [Chloroflexota bacterium]